MIHRPSSAAVSSPVTWLVEDYIPANTVTLLSSVSGSGKSMLALHLAFCLLSGSDWMGLKCRQSAFAYWDQDNPDTWLTDNRICAIKRGLGLNGDLPYAPIFRTNERVIGSQRNIIGLIAALRDMGITVLIVDTLASVNPYAESDPNEMARAIVDNFFPMVDAGITPIILHHIGKDIIDNKGGSRRRTGIHAARGSSALVAAVGAAFNLDKDGETRRLECVKPRYGLAPTLKIDYDEDGHMGSDDWIVRISSPSARVNQDFVVQFIKQHGLESVSSRKLVSLLKDRCYTTSQMTAARALNRTK